MAQGVVDPLEVVDIQADEGAFVAMATGAGKGTTTAVLKQPPVCRVGEHVEMGKIVKLVLGLADFSDVLANQYQLLGAFFVVVIFQLVQAPENDVAAAIIAANPGFQRFLTTGTKGFQDLPGQFITIFFGNKRFQQVSANRLVPAVAEQGFGGRIPLTYAEPGIQQHDGGGGCLEQGAEMA